MRIVRVASAAGGSWRAVTALGFWLRLRGLVCRKRSSGAGARVLLGMGEVCLLFPRCRAVHTFFMRQPIDVAFISPRGCVLGALRNVPPFRALSCRGAACALERMARPDLPWPKEGERLFTDGLAGAADDGI